MLKSKSGLNIKHGIVSEGVIDEGFSGEIMVKLYNLSDQDHRFERGDKITQLVVMPVHYVTYEMADEIQGGARGSAGYGSTGR
jgi:dUTP pyrophosphatase